MTLKTAFHTDLFDEMSLDRAVSRSNKLKSILGNADSESSHKMAGVACDIWSLLYKDNPRYNFEDGVELNHAVIRKLEKSVEFAKLRSQTRHDSIASEHALASFSGDLDKWSRLIETPDLSDLTDTIHREINGELTGDEEFELDLKLNKLLDVDELIEILERSAEKSSDEIGAVYAMASGCGFNIRSMAAGKDNGEAWKLFNKMKDSKSLQKLMNLAGRLTRMSSASKKMKVRPGQTEIFEVGLSDDINRVVGSELIYLSEPELEDIFYLKLAQASLQSYELQSTETVGKGPVVACIDASSSMRKALGGQTRFEWAKAVAISLAMKCKREKRNLHVIFFNSRVFSQFFFKEGKMTVDELSKLVSIRSHGGTSIAPPLSTSIKKIERQREFKKADVVFVSDGESSLAPQFVSDFNDKKSEMNFSVMTACIGYKPGKALTDISDSIHTVGSENSDNFVMKVL